MTPRIPRSRALATALLFGVLSTGCGQPPPAVDASVGAAMAHDEHDDDRGPLMLLLSRTGREALGISIARVEQRPRRGAFDLPGRVEPVPGARRVAAAPVAGRLQLLRGSLEEVAAGDALFGVDAPSLWETRAVLAELEAEDHALEVWLEQAEHLELAHREREEALLLLVERWERRLGELRALREAAGGQGEALAAAETAHVEALARFAEARELGAEHHAEAAERRAMRTGIAARREALFAGLGQVLGRTQAELHEADASGEPLWRRIEQVEVRTSAAGVIDDILATDGAWVQAGDVVLGLRNPRALWIKAEALQAELPGLERATAAFARPADDPPGEGGGPAGEVGSRAVPIRLAPGLEADPRRRTAEVLAFFDGAVPPWARPGLAVRIAAAVEAADAGFAVPAAAVRRDGLDRGVWVQDPGDPARLVFVHVKVLAEDRGWVWIDDEDHSDHDHGEGQGQASADLIHADTRVVVRGAGRLLLATRGALQTGGHFHADGTFHADDH